LTGGQSWPAHLGVKWTVDPIGNWGISFPHLEAKYIYISWIRYIEEITKSPLGEIYLTKRNLIMRLTIDKVDKVVDTVDNDWWTKWWTKWTMTQ
jgi:hypothetical protein